MNPFFEGLNEKAQSLFKPANKVGKLVVENVNELIEIQSKSLGAYTELGMGQAKAAMEIRDTESLSAFLKQQTEIAESVQTQFKGDIEKMSELATKATKEVSDAFSTNSE